MAKINFNNKSGVIIAHVSLQVGDQKVRPKMALDTGASYVMIPWNIAESLGLKPELSKEKIEMITASGMEITPLVTLESISVAGNEVKNVIAIVHDLPPKSHVDGLLGLSFLKNFNLHINFKKGYFELI
ncbi:MAG: TIGR02281 family clan AA aspartic protease [Cytophagales bacterium]|nr:TIGR02281 family clan AA aspartic protease [Cytophagales bacterium]